MMNRGHIDTMQIKPQRKPRETVMANEKSMFISSSYDGLSFALNTVNAGFTYEPGSSNFIRKNMTGGKTKGTGTCRINELMKKF